MSISFKQAKKFFCAPLIAGQLTAAGCATNDHLNAPKPIELHLGTVMSMSGTTECYTSAKGVRVHAYIGPLIDAETHSAWSFEVDAVGSPQKFKGAAHIYNDQLAGNYLKSARGGDQPISERDTLNPFAAAARARLMDCRVFLQNMPKA